MNFIQEWSNSLSEHLQFSRDSLSVQQSMFETSSNDGAWCYCCMHVYHASTLIALNNVRWNFSSSMSVDNPLSGTAVFAKGTRPQSRASVGH